MLFKYYNTVTEMERKVLTFYVKLTYTPLHLHLHLSNRDVSCCSNSVSPQPKIFIPKMFFISTSLVNIKWEMCKVTLCALTKPMNAHRIKDDDIHFLQLSCA